MPSSEWHQSFFYICHALVFSLIRKVPDLAGATGEGAPVTQWYDAML